MIGFRKKVSAKYQVIYTPPPLKLKTERRHKKKRIANFTRSYRGTIKTDQQVLQLAIRFPLIHPHPSKTLRDTLNIIAIPHPRPPSRRNGDKDPF